MTSPSLRHKIAQTMEAAPAELPKARLCAKVIWASLESAEALQAATADLKHGAGNNWSPTLAFQFMSGRRGEFAADCSPPEEQEQLRFAHQFAEYVCDHEEFGAVLSRHGVDVPRLRSLALAVKERMQ